MLSNQIYRARWALMVLMFFGASAVAHAQNTSQTQNQSANENEQEGEIIQIGPDRSNQTNRNEDRGGRRMFQPGFPEPDFSGEVPRQAPAYWVGLVGGPVEPAVRHHIDLPEGVGLEVLEVVPDGPAAEAGLQQYDIMVRAGDTPLDEMQDLVEIVLAEGERQGQIALEIVRGATTETIWITPALRPADARMPRRGPQGPFGGQGRGLQGFLGGILGNGQEGGFGFRHLGPGVVLDGQQQMSFQQLPDGTSVKVEKNDGQPTKITVERGDEAWEVEGDDPAALDQLPDNVRPYVEQMLGQAQHPGGNFAMPQFENQSGQRPFIPQMTPPGDMNDRLQQMEQQMRELRERLTGPNPDNDGDVQ